MLQAPVLLEGTLTTKKVPYLVKYLVFTLQL